MTITKLFKQALPTLLVVSTSMSLLSITGCSKPAQPTTKPVYPAANLTDDDYQPGPGWQLVWSDEFEGDKVNPDNWNYQVLPAGRFNGEWQRYTDSEQNAFIDQGNLVIKAIHESTEHGHDQYTSARLNTAGKQTWQYGRVAARIQMPYGTGMWPAFWMLGANIDENGGDTPWPLSGEIDIMEFYGSKDNGAVEVNMHFAGPEGQHGHMGAVKYELEQGFFADNYHVFEMEWDAEKIIWYVDGEEVTRHPLTDEIFSEFHQPYFILLNIAVGGEWSGRPDETSVFPQVMYIDWVRVYQKS